MCYLFDGITFWYKVSYTNIQKKQGYINKFLLDIIYGKFIFEFIKYNRLEVMKKIVIALALLLIVGIGYCTVLNESFTDTQFPPDGWSSPSTSWKREVSQVHSAPGSACSGCQTGTWWLVTPRLRPTAENHIFSFWYKNAADGSGWDVSGEYTDVLVSTTTNFSNATVLWHGTSSMFKTLWQQCTIDMSYYIDINIYIAFKHVATGINYHYIDDITGLNISYTSVPNPAVIQYPANGDIAFTTTLLSWSSNGGMPTYYDVYLDTVNPPQTLVSSHQTLKTYKATDLSYSSTYYWKVIPYNELGPANNCPIWSFTTPTATQLAESFERSFPPYGWMANEWFNSSDAKDGNYSAFTYGSATTQYVLSTPRLIITPTSNLTFWVKCANDLGSLQIVYSANRTSWFVLNTISFDYSTYSKWIKKTISLSSLAGENYYIGFRSGTTSDDAKYYVDAVLGPDMPVVVPGQPSLSIPQNNATNVILSPSFKWSSPTVGSPATGYKLYLGLSNPPEYFTDSSKTSYVMTDTLEYNTTYYWTVSALNSAGEGLQAPVRSFTTKSPPPPNAPALVSPENNTIDVEIYPTLTWTAPSIDAEHGGATHYKLYYRTSTKEEYSIDNVTETYYTFTESLDYNTTYYWKVAGINSSGEGTPSEEWQFTTEEQPYQTLVIPLKTGWNLISSWVIPPDLSIEVLFEDLRDLDYLEKIQDDLGNYYVMDINEQWQNTIGNYQMDKGYYVLVNNICEFLIDGNYVELPVTIDLNAGWNIIPYLYPNSQEAWSLISPLIDSGVLIKVQDETGNKIVKDLYGEWINEIGLFKEGKSYYILVSESCQINYNVVE